ncbi:MAG TPA: hypothetical protein VFB58_13530 [Chloroflexota bacterium]|nr:hypothetical protein [Chloroflexota bacterium]
MQAPLSPPDVLTLGQDEESEIRIQPAIQGDVRHLDIRIWRRTPSGLAPTRDALVLDRSDLEAVRRGIGELLEVSDGGKQVARIVLDMGDSRRLRAETEPFGTRYVAHLGFWQRSRDTWNADGAGIVLGADLLVPLQKALRRFLRWLEMPVQDATQEIPVVLDRPESWPRPGADWLTVEQRRVAFHPRGVRITCALRDGEQGHRISLRQWRREDSIWVPEEIAIELALADLDTALAALRSIVTGDRDEERLTLADDSFLTLRLADGALTVLHDGQPRLSVPDSDLPRFGRALAEGWALLLRAVPREERAGMDDEALLEAAEEEEVVLAPPEPLAPPVPIGREPGHGEITVFEESIHIMDGNGHAITLPAAVLDRVVRGLEDLYSLQRSQSRVGPMLICDQPDCAVYGRIGTSTRPNAVEVRVWESPRESAAVTIDRSDLDALIDALRASLRLLDLAEPEPSTAFLVARSMQPEPEPEPEPETESIAEPPPEAVPATVPLGDLVLETVRLHLDVEEQQTLVVRHGETVVRLPLPGLSGVLSDVRSLYYDAVRGRRGRTVQAGPTTIGIRNQGTTLMVDLQDGADGPLSFRASEVPAFLDAMRAALDDI